MHPPDIPPERSHDFLFKDADASKPVPLVSPGSAFKKTPAGRAPAALPKRVAISDALFKEKDVHDFGIVRIRVRHHGRLTTISLDEVMYKIGVALIPGQGMFETWIQNEISAADLLDSNNPGAAGIRNKSGFSRQVQRRVLQMIVQTMQKR